MHGQPLQRARGAGQRGAGAVPVYQQCRGALRQDQGQGAAAGRSPAPPAC